MKSSLTTGMSAMLWAYSKHFSKGFQVKKHNVYNVLQKFTAFYSKKLKCLF